MLNTWARWKKQKYNSHTDISAYIYIYTHTQLYYISELNPYKAGYRWLRRRDYNALTMELRRCRNHLSNMFDGKSGKSRKGMCYTRLRFSFVQNKWGLFAFTSRIMAYGMQSGVCLFVCWTGVMFSNCVSFYARNKALVWMRFFSNLVPLLSFTTSGKRWWILCLADRVSVSLSFVWNYDFDCCALLEHTTSTSTSKGFISRKYTWA